MNGFGQLVLGTAMAALLALNAWIAATVTEIKSVTSGMSATVIANEKRIDTMERTLERLIFGKKESKP